MAEKTKRLETLIHSEAKRRNIPTAEYQSLMKHEIDSPVLSSFERRNRDLDPQLFWRGKDEQNWSELVVPAPPLYIQEKIHPKVLIDDLKRQSKDGENTMGPQLRLFEDFNGLPLGHARTEFYQHDANWSNRMILGDSLQVMASLAEREGLQSKVQCIYVDPPYGIKFNSNFQWSTTSKSVKDGKREHITREPEQVKAFRDTWRDGIHSYLTYLRDRLTVARDLLEDSGSIFVQIGDENVHRVRALMDEVFGEENFVNQINCRTNSGTTRGDSLKRTCDYILWYAKDSENKKFRRLVVEREVDTKMYNRLMYDDCSTRSMSMAEKTDPSLLPEKCKSYTKLPMHSMTGGENNSPRRAFGRRWSIPSNRSWRHSIEGFERLLKAFRIEADKTALRSRYFHSDYPVSEITETWTDTGPEINKSYVVQTSEAIIKRCILLTTDPGDLVLDPTCGSGTTAYVSEQWGRRWITIDTSRVALALARARIMGAQFPFYTLTDSVEGKKKEAEILGKYYMMEKSTSNEVFGDIRQGFVYERVPHVTLKSIANNTEIDVIWEKYQDALETLRSELNEKLGCKYEEWNIPHKAKSNWSDSAKELHKEFWNKRIACQKEINASIDTNADYEYLYDKPYKIDNVVRVAGPFTVESLSPNRFLGFDENDELIDNLCDDHGVFGAKSDFANIILDNLKLSGVQQPHKEDKIDFSSVKSWPGKLVCAEGFFEDIANEDERKSSDSSTKRAAIFIGPEFGTVSRPDLVAAVREAVESEFDVLIACAFNFDAHASEFDKLGHIRVLKARMNADLHMAQDLKNTKKGNLFVIFGEPDIRINNLGDDQIQIEIKGVDAFHPQTGEVRSDGTDGIVCWFIDTDYNEESFMVRHAYFLGNEDPYKGLKRSLKSEINQDIWETLYSDTSRPFKKPISGRIAVKVINHLGDEVLKVYRV